MSINVCGTASVICAKCGKANKLPLPSESDWELAETHERDMGVERNYEYETEVLCSCRNFLKLKVAVWEYPVGAFNTDDYSTTNCSVADKWTIGFQVD